MSSDATAQPWRFHPPSRRVVSSILAVTLTLIAYQVTNYVVALHPFPMALQFLAIALVSTLGGLGPGLITVALSVATRIDHLWGGPHTTAILHAETLRSCILLSCAFIISFMGRKRRLSENRLEVALSQLQERSDALVASLSSSKCASWVLDFDSDNHPNIRWYNGSYLVFGRDFLEIEAMPSFLSVIHPDDRPRVAAIVDTMRSSQKPIFSEHRVTWPNGDVHWLEVRGTRIPGKETRWRGVTLDITDRKLAEAALLRSEKLAVMGRLASTVAHEINNPLEAVTNLLFLAHTDPSLRPETRTYIATAERELARLGHITRLTLGFVRNSGVATTIDLAESVDDVLSIFQHRLETRRIQVKRHYEPEVRVTIALHELRQIATNLIANAADAVNGPTPTIVIRVMSSERKAVLLVEDDGDGIAPAHLERVFEPFFSTKDEVGTGIGLWVTKEIAEKNAGQISAESGDLGSGISTRFRVELPLAKV